MIGALAARLADSNEFQDSEELERSVIRALWRRGLVQRFEPTAARPAREVLFTRLQSRGLFLGPRGYPLFEAALARLLAVGALVEAEGALVLPLYSADRLRDARTAASPRTDAPTASDPVARKQAQNERAHLSRWRRVHPDDARSDAELLAEYHARPHRSRQRRVTPVVTAAGASAASPVTSEAPAAVTVVTVTGDSVPREREFETSLSPSPEIQSQTLSPTARATPAPLVTPPVVTPVTTVTSVTSPAPALPSNRAAVLRSTAAGRLGSASPEVDAELDRRLGELGVDLDFARELGALAARGALPLQDKHAVMSVGVLLANGARVLASWVDTGRAARVARVRDAAHEAQHQRDLTPIATQPPLVTGRHYGKIANTPNGTGPPLQAPPVKALGREELLEAIKTAKPSG